MDDPTTHVTSLRKGNEMAKAACQQIFELGYVLKFDYILEMKFAVRKL
jgi:hypothetical protein